MTISFTSSLDPERFPPGFCGFITGRKNSQQLLDSDGFTYGRRKDRDTDTSSRWRCSKMSGSRCPATVTLITADQSLKVGPRPHNHPPEQLIEELLLDISSHMR